MKYSAYLNLPITVPSLCAVRVAVKLVRFHTSMKSW